MEHQIPRSVKQMEEGWWYWLGVGVSFVQQLVVCVVMVVGVVMGLSIMRVDGGGCW